MKWCVVHRTSQSGLWEACLGWAGLPAPTVVELYWFPAAGLWCCAHRFLPSAQNQLHGVRDNLSGNSLHHIFFLFPVVSCSFGIHLNGLLFCDRWLWFCLLHTIIFLQPLSLSPPCFSAVPTPFIPFLHSLCQ